MVHSQVQRRKARTIVCVAIVVVVCSARHNQRVPTVLRLPCVTLTHSLARLVVGTLVNRQIQGIRPLAWCRIRIHPGVHPRSRVCGSVPCIAVTYRYSIYIMLIRKHRYRLACLRRALSPIRYSNTVLCRWWRRDGNTRNGIQRRSPQIRIRLLLNHKIVDSANGTLVAIWILWQCHKLSARRSIKACVWRCIIYASYGPCPSTRTFRTCPIIHACIKTRKIHSRDAHTLQDG